MRYIPSGSARVAPLEALRRDASLVYAASSPVRSAAVGPSGRSAGLTVGPVPCCAHAAASGVRRPGCPAWPQRDYTRAICE
jgi:hypothetical protein